MSTLVVLAILVVLGLLSYWLYLQHLLRLQRQRQRAALAERQSHLRESICTIARACVAGQCDSSEAALRLTSLLLAYPCQPRVDWPQRFPALFGLAAQISHLPTHQARLELSRTKRREQDRFRVEQQQHYAQKMEQELRQLCQFSQ